MVIGTMFPYIPKMNTNNIVILVWLPKNQQKFSFNSIRWKPYEPLLFQFNIIELLNMLHERRIQKWNCLTSWRIEFWCFLNPEWESKIMEAIIDQTVSLQESYVRLESCKMNINYENDFWCLPLQTNKIFTLLNSRIDLVAAYYYYYWRWEKKWKCEKIRFKIHIESGSGDISTWIFFLIKRIIWYASVIHVRQWSRTSVSMNDEIMNSFQELEFIAI